MQAQQFFKQEGTGSNKLVFSHSLTPLEAAAVAELCGSVLAWRAALTM